MSDKRYSREVTIEIWNDTVGDSVVVRLDRDGLNMVEVLYRGEDRSVQGTLLLTVEQAILVSQALLDCVDNNPALRAERDHDDEGEVES